jgi:hypothetical protein
MAWDERRPSLILTYPAQRLDTIPTGACKKRKEMKTTAYAGAGGWRMRMFVLLAAVVVALVGVSMVGQRSASAHDHLIPRTVLVKSEGDVVACPSLSGGAYSTI